MSKYAVTCRLPDGDINYRTTFKTYEQAKAHRDLIDGPNKPCSLEHTIDTIKET